MRELVRRVMFKVWCSFLERDLTCSRPGLEWSLLVFVERVERRGDRGSPLKVSLGQ